MILNFFQKKTLLLCLLFSINAHGKDLTTKEFSIIQEKLSQRDKLSLRFTQSTFKSLRKNTVESKGYVYFLKPDKFRWAKESPEKEEWIYDGTKLFQLNPTTKEATQFTKTAGKAKELNLLVDLVLNFKALEKSYTIHSIKEESDLITIDMSPKQGSDLKKVLCVFDQKKNMMTSVKLEFENKNHTIFYFSDPDFVSVASSSFEIPKGIKISEGL